MLSASPPTPVRIDPAAVYTVPALVLLLDMASVTITGAIRRGELPAVRRGRQTYISGRALLVWLTPEPTANAVTDDPAEGVVRS